MDDNSKIDLFADLEYAQSINPKNKKKEQVEVLEEILDTDIEIEDDVVRTVKVHADTRKKYASSVPARSVEEYNEHIESTYYEEFYHEDGTPYSVKVTVLKPGQNPHDQLRPAYAYATSS